MILFIPGFNPYFTGLPILIIGFYQLTLFSVGFNPYFTGLPILIYVNIAGDEDSPEVSILILLDYLFLSKSSLEVSDEVVKFQSLFYWITYSYTYTTCNKHRCDSGFNPYFTGLPILILTGNTEGLSKKEVSILILLDYLFLLKNKAEEAVEGGVVSILILLDYLFL